MVRGHEDAYNGCSSSCSFAPWLKQVAEAVSWPSDAPARLAMPDHSERARDAAGVDDSVAKLGSKH